MTDIEQQILLNQYFIMSALMRLVGDSDYKDDVKALMTMTADTKKLLGI